MLNTIKLLIKSNYFFLKVVRLVAGQFGFYRRKRHSKLDDFWEKRIELVVCSPDNPFINRVPDAGEVYGDIQIMHNGLKIHVGSYYGDGNTVLLYKNKGVHEPQEERAFDEILKFVPAEGVMLELGAFWGFYSMSFHQAVKRGKCYLIEPDPHALLSGRNNFRLNKLKGSFFNYFISDHPAEGIVPTITVSEFLKQSSIDHLHILHSDIQGYELKMLHGAAEFLKHSKIDYIFISTHSNDLHEDCKAYLKGFHYKILCDANLDETYSWDGLIVAKHELVNGPEVLEIHKRKC